MCLVANMSDSVHVESAFERSRNGEVVAGDQEEDGGLGIETK